MSSWRADSWELLPRLIPMGPLQPRLLATALLACYLFKSAPFATTDECAATWCMVFFLSLSLSCLPSPKKKYRMFVLKCSRLSRFTLFRDLFRLVKHGPLLCFTTLKEFFHSGFYFPGKMSMWECWHKSNIIFRLLLRCVRGDFLKVFLHLERGEVNEYTPSFALLCGGMSDVPHILYSSESALVLEFHSDRFSSNSSGFHGNFRFVNRREYLILINYFDSWVYKSSKYPWEKPKLISHFKLGKFICGIIFVMLPWKINRKITLKV